MNKGVRPRFSNHERNQSRGLYDKMGWELKGYDNQLHLMMTSGGANAGWCREAFPLLRPQKDVIFIALLLVLVSLGGRDSERRIMGGDPVTTEPTVLKVDEENDGKVTVNGLEFIISKQLIADVSSLPRDGEIISREKTNQVGQLTKFIKDDETLCWLQSGIAWDSLQKPWERVAVQIMKYLTLEGKFLKIFGYHIVILNSIRNDERINIPLFLLKSLEKSIKVVKTEKGRVPLHQGLLKLLYLHEKDKRGSSARSVKRGFPRTSKTPVSKAQLLLGPTPASPILKTSAIISDTEEDSDSQGEDIPFEGSKKDGARKRKPSPQALTANLAKCKEEIEDSDAGKSVEVGKFAKDVGPRIPDKGSVKGPDGVEFNKEPATVFQQG
eukprot:Gb_12244 [translate_table: standard]